jgi:hypothetical protein
MTRKAAKAAPRAQVQRSEEETPDPLLKLQRESGNAAVARMLVQRDRAASTDAPGYRKPKKAPPKKAPEDIHGRIVKYDVDQDMGKITIALGPDQGVQVGMSGSMLSDTGREYKDFVIDSASGRVSTAHLQVNLDEVKRNDTVVIKPATLESQEGKEF